MNTRKIIQSLLSEGVSIPSGEKTIKNFVAKVPKNPNIKIGPIREYEDRFLVEVRTQTSVILTPNLIKALKTYAKDYKNLVAPLVNSKAEFSGWFETDPYHPNRGGKTSDQLRSFKDFVNSLMLALDNMESVVNAPKVDYTKVTNYHIVFTIEQGEEKDYTDYAQAHFDLFLNFDPDYKHFTFNLFVRRIEPRG